MQSAKKLFGLGVVVSINLILQFLFQWYIIVSFGAGVQSDAFFGAMALPQFILLALSGSLTMVLIPLISKYDGNEFLKESWSYFQGIGILFSIIALTLLLTAQWWVHLLLPGFTAQNFLLALNLTRIQLIAMVLSAMLSVLWAIHSARENFYLIETTSIIANIIAFVFLYFAIHYIGIYAAAWVSVVRVLLQMLLLMRILGPYQKPQLHSPSFKEAWKKVKPLIAGNMYYKTDMLVDRYLTSSGASGELTLLNLAQQLYSAGNSILSKVLVNTMVPRLAKKYLSNNKKAFKNLFFKRLIISIVTTCIVTFFIIFFGKWIFETLFAIKSFNVEDVGKLWWLLILLSGYWIGSLLGAVTSSTFYAIGNTATPTKIGVINFTLYIPVKIFCYYKFGIQGLAISVSAYYIISFIFQMFSLVKYFRLKKM